MKKLAIVIPTHNPNEQCYENILNYLNLKLVENVIYVVNNNSTELEYIEKLRNHKEIIIKDSIYGGAFEAGALLQAYNEIDAENYLLIQDSIKLNEPYEVNYYCKYVSDFVLAFSLLYPIGFVINDEIKKYILEFDYNFNYDFFELFGIQFCTFVAKKHQISKLIESKILIEKNLPKSKLACESWERIFGLGFFNNNIKMKGFDIQATEEDAKNYAPYTPNHILNISQTKYYEKYNKYYLARS
jgi:hypothetical protein